MSISITVGLLASGHRVFCASVELQADYEEMTVESPGDVCAKE